MPALRYSTSEGDKILPLQEILSIGRDARNDLALPDDPMVSYQHARIRQVGDTYVVEDLRARTARSWSGSQRSRASRRRSSSSPTMSSASARPG